VCATDDDSGRIEDLEFTLEVLTDFQQRHAATDVLRFFKQIDGSVPRGLEGRALERRSKAFIWRATAAEIIAKVERGRVALHQIKSTTDH
jgi:hypothetical protein